MRNKNFFNIIALIVLLIYVISPVDAIPGPVDDTILCLLYAYMNYRNRAGSISDNNELDDTAAV